MKKLLSILFIFLNISAFSQITVTHFNAEWNSANGVEWITKLSDCDVSKVDIVKQPKLQTKHKIVVVPTIIVFKDGEEVKRFQADVSFKMAATREEIQDYIDELIMSDF
jgi:thiol-disulfide isomerase/thioredoxin